MLSFGVIGNAVLLVLGGWWCWEILRRFRRDLEEFRSPSDSSDRLVIAGLWAATAVILVFWIGNVARILSGRWVA